MRRSLTANESANPRASRFFVAKDQDIDKSTRFRLSCADARSFAYTRGNLPDANLRLRFFGDSLRAIGR